MIIINKLVNYIYPPTCGICGKLNNNFLCKNCEIIINELKVDCIDKYNYEKTIYNNHYYIFPYEGIIRKMMIDYKFNDCAYIYKTFQKILINDKKVCDFIKSYDIIIPVPIHKYRKRERGYNQSFLMINEFVHELNSIYNYNIKISDKIISKVNNTCKQSLLSKKERIRNIQNAFIVCEEKINEIKNKNILIFDDIYTTGTTVTECAKAINSAKPNKIDVFTFTKNFLK